MRLKRYYIVLILILAVSTNSKRSRGRSRGSSSGSSNFWSRKNKASEPQKPVASPPKPSAPKEPEIKKQTANVQQNSPVNSGRPIGWNVDNSNRKYNQPGNLEAQKQHINPSYASGAAYPHNAPGAYPNTGLYSNPHNGPYSGAYPNTGLYSNPHNGPIQNTGFYSNQHAPGGYPNQGGFPHNPGYPGHNNFGHYNPQPPGYYPNQMGGFGGYPQHQTGMMGSSFGGNKHGFGGYGGMGGLGGYGYGMKKSGGFFGKHAFRNVLGGLFVWYLVSGLIRTPYKVYNYHNLPREQREEITLPANVLTLCNENATNICIPGTVAICTQDNKILCVANMTAATPCQNNTGELCVNSIIPCLDDKDPLCQNGTNTDNTTTVNLPCFTNMTLDTSQMSSASNVTLPVSDSNKFCVTTMAVPDPNAPPPEDAGTSTNNTNTTDVNTPTIDNSTSSEVKNENTGFNPSNVTGWDYYYLSRYGSAY